MQPSLVEHGGVRVAISCNPHLDDALMIIDRMPLVVSFYPIFQNDQVACRDVRPDISNSQAEQRRSLLMMRTKPSKPMPPS